MLVIALVSSRIAPCLSPIRENDPRGNYSRGADASSTASQIWITNDTSGGSHQALQWSTNVDEGGFPFTVDSGPTPVLWLAVFTDGTLHANTTTNTSEYVPLNASVPMNAWSTVSSAGNRPSGDQVLIDDVSFS
ncbi:hypothetical protein [Virgisporangium aurantiacum]|uniref:Uncharacterized protein n=1 Tax=Virgisporangium aurantiacum TaxID=175570 RepID=A0A8J3ZIQ0_9ACTN|nr:hypothetical protein [Virgisporangium aurantiacum]GIJ64619.1 hypothetical protein Vau01_121350 [Virgisporangium aurantiacum]